MITEKRIQRPWSMEIGIIISIKGMKTTKRGMAIAGLIVNGLVLAIFVIAFVVVI